MFAKFEIRRDASFVSTRARGVRARATIRDGTRDRRGGVRDDDE
jgi:hypothetical protein